jgi:phosphoglycerate dehydrogenase-like enzyme
LLPIADHLVLALPETADTTRLLDARAFALMKPGAHLVNIARGGIVDQDALIAALDAGQIGGASLDVTTPEPLPPGHPLYTHPKVRLTPHISFSAPGPLLRATEKFLTNFERFRNGEPLIDEVDLAKGY